MSVEVLFVLAVGALVVGIWYFWPKADVNKDGKVDVADVKAAADVNNDGKVNVEDAKVVVEKAKGTAKKAGAKAKATVKKATSKTK